MLCSHSYISATVIGAITKCAFVVIKSSLSKMYPESDGGKVFSALSSVQAVVPFVSRPLVTALFNRENHEASAYFFTSAMFFVLMTIFLLIRLVRTRDQNDYEAVDGDVHPELWQLAIFCTYDKLRRWARVRFDARGSLLFTMEGWWGQKMSFSQHFWADFSYH